MRIRQRPAQVSHYNKPHFFPKPKCVRNLSNVFLLFWFWVLYKSEQSMNHVVQGPWLAGCGEKIVSWSCAVIPWSVVLFCQFGFQRHKANRTSIETHRWRFAAFVDTVFIIDIKNTEVRAGGDVGPIFAPSVIKNLLYCLKMAWFHRPGVPGMSKSADVSLNAVYSSVRMEEVDF